MNRQFTTSMTYFLQEGKANLRECLRIAFEAARNHNVTHMVIFTSEGEGVRIAMEEFCTRPEFQNVKLIAVTFAVGKPFTDAEGQPLRVEISSVLREELRAKAIPIVRAHLPFDAIASNVNARGVLGQDLSLVESALNIFGGSMSLCVQAVMMACDAGEIAPHEHVIALTSDTAILAQAAPTNDMLRALAVREVLCKPAIYTIGRAENADQLTLDTSAAQPITIDGGSLPALPENSNPK